MGIIRNILLSPSSVLFQECIEMVCVFKYLICCRLAYKSMAGHSINSRTLRKSGLGTARVLVYLGYRVRRKSRSYTVT